jgi:CTP:molybdopterin cytidylyltransferase MocA
MISALLLAAGQGSRMGHKAKGLLRLGERTFVQHALQQLDDAGLQDLVLVTGAQREAVWESARTAHIPVREAYNADFATGLLSSIQRGLRALPTETSAVLITLVDLPFLTADDYRAACLAWQSGKPTDLLRSESAGKPGHPVIIPRAYFSEILEQPASDKGCSFLFQRYPDSVRYQTLDRGRIDIDTIEDYHAHITS